MLAASGLLRAVSGATAGLPDGVVARVNDSVILREDYERLIAGIDSETREPLDDEARQRVLDRMIEEELLVQRALELGLATSDRRIRGELVSAIIRSVVVEVESREPTRAELERFFEEQSAFFTRPGRLRVDQVFFRVRDASEDADAATRANAALESLRGGEAFESVVERAGDAVISPIPAVLLPPAKLREYLGPTAVAVASKLEAGGISEPVRSGVGYHILRVVEREASRTPPFAEIEDQVRVEWRRQRGDQALRDYLSELRDRADVSARPVAELDDDAR